MTLAERSFDDCVQGTHFDFTLCNRIWDAFEHEQLALIHSRLQPGEKATAYGVTMYGR